ncbi:hypothetical protein ACFVR2_17590 [Gottfriedia sp. NPDC057991]
MKNTITYMWSSIALLLFVVSIGILLKIMHVPPYGTDFIKNIFQ